MLILAPASSTRISQEFFDNECDSRAMRSTWSSASTQISSPSKVRWRVVSARTSDDSLIDCREDRLRFIRQLMRLEHRRQPRAASDLIVDFFDDHFEVGDFVLCDLVLRDITEIDTSLFSDIVLVALLAVTFPARRRLHSRTRLFNRIHRELADRHGDEEASLMLDSLQ